VHPHVEGSDDQGEFPAEAKACEVALTELHPIARRARQPSEPLAGLLEHRGHGFDSDDGDARFGDRKRNPAGPHAKLKHGATRLGRQSGVEPHVVPSPTIRLIVVGTVFVVCL
jgi:hypothetical protein